MTGRPMCEACGEYPALVFDPDGPMWCHRCAPTPSASSATEAGDPEHWLDDPAAAAWHCGKSSREAVEPATSDDRTAGQPDQLTTGPYAIPEWIVKAQADIEHDAVNHPSHYTQGPPCPGCGRTIECIDITRHMGFDLGNAVKYIWRCDLKADAIEDLRKAVFYINDEIARREREAAASA